MRFSKNSLISFCHYNTGYWRMIPAFPTQDECLPKWARHTTTQLARSKTLLLWWYIQWRPGHGWQSRPHSDVHIIKYTRIYICIYTYVFPMRIGSFTRYARNVCCVYVCIQESCFLPKTTLWCEEVKKNSSWKNNCRFRSASAKTRQFVGNFPARSSRYALHAIYNNITLCFITTRLYPHLATTCRLPKSWIRRI